MLGRMMASALALTGVAYAQTPPPAGEAAVTPTTSSADRVSYDVAFFQQFNPQTALDMVNQTPGFSLNGGDDRRGFSGAVGNLLIDGVRPSTKSQSLSGILSRIPATQVVRVEVLRGASVAGDASGQSVLLNIVRTPTAGSGLWEAGVEYTSREVAAPRGELSYSGRNGNFEYGVGASIFSEYRDLPGWREYYDETGALEAEVDTPLPQDFREATINGNVAFPLAGGRLSATSQVNWWRFHADRDYIATAPGTGASLETLSHVFEEDRGSVEIGANFDRDFGPWSLGLTGLVDRAHYESEEIGANVDFVGTDDFAYAQFVKQDIGESILRGTISRALNAQHRIEVGGEGAFNSLDQELIFAFNGTPQTIPNSNVLIEEQRAEFFGAHTWRVNDRWSLDSRLAWETSTLDFTGDDNQTTELAFWKPSVQITRTFGGNNQLRFRYYRDVGQLNFGDFVSAAAVADDLIDGGNTDLTPQTDWRAELGADLRFPGGAALSLTLTHHQFEDVNDLVTLSELVPNPDEDPGIPGDETVLVTFDAPGNIGEAEGLSLDVNFSSPVPFVPGGRITVSGYLWDTEVTDPLTGGPRIISNQPESQIHVSFRQDIAAWRMAWGVEYEKQGETQAYRFNEIDTGEEGPWIDLWVETTALPYNTRMRLWAANAFDGTIVRDRRFFQGDRNGPPGRRDLRQRQFAEAPWFIVELSGTF